MAENLTRCYQGKTVLCVGAHPDDIELGIGGTVARLRQAGARVVMAVACIPSQYETRLEEAKRSAGILGGELRLLLDRGCVRVEDVRTYELVGILDELLKELEPAALFSHGSKDFHKDHTLVHAACQAARRLSPVDFFCYYPTACRPSAFQFQPQAFVDISDTLETKMQAVDAHPSQFSARGLPTDFLRDIAREHGRVVGVPYAEGLEVVHMTLS